MGKVGIEEENNEGLEKILHLQTVGHGLSSVIRFKNSREGLGILNQSVAEHKFNMTLMVDVFKKRINAEHEVDWNKVDKMIRYHDVGEIVDGDIVCTHKSQEDRELEKSHQEDVLADFPFELGDEISELLAEKEELKTIEARIVHLLDKLEPEILIATERGIQEIKDLHRENGIDNERFAFRKFYHLLNSLKEWKMDFFIEFVEELWERQVELGILKNDPQLSIEKEEEIEGEAETQDDKIESGKPIEERDRDKDRELV